MKKVYLAGPDVFYANAVAQFADLNRLASLYGLEGLVPSDGGLSKGYAGTKDEIAERIFRENLAMIRGADCVIANLTPFRGAIEPDSGTAFEWAFAYALGIPLAGYINCSESEQSFNYEDFIAKRMGREIRDGVPYDKEFGHMIEEFEQPMNLMISRSGPVFRSAEQAMWHLAELLSKAVNK